MANQAAISALKTTLGNPTEKKNFWDELLTFLYFLATENTGDETALSLGATLNASSAAVPNDTDIVATAESSVLKKITWTNVKAFLKTYFDGVYQTILVSGSNIKTVNGNTLLGAGDVVVSGGATAFTGLSDVPASYATHALKAVRVNAGATGLEFFTLSGGGDMLAANNLSELVASASTARSNLGLGTIATQNSTALSGSFSYNGFSLWDSADNHVLTIRPAEDLSANKVLNIVVNNVSRTLTFTGDASISGTNTGDQTLNGLLPSQATHSGKFLQTDGSNASWQTASGGSGLTQPQVMARNLGC